MLVKCGWEMNWRNDPHTCWTIPAIFSYVHLKNFQVSSTGFEPMTSAMPAQCSNQLRCSQMWAGQFDNRCDCPASVRIISSINLTLTWNFSSAGRLMYSDLNEGPLYVFSWRVNEYFTIPWLVNMFFTSTGIRFSIFHDPWSIHLLTRDSGTSDLWKTDYSNFWKF